jgi:hypothetical protein
MSYATIDDLRSHLGAKVVPAESAAYAAKMLHALPSGAIVNREAFVLERCLGRKVLEFGASGRLHDELVKVSTVIGVDRHDSDGVIGFDLDDVTQPALPGPLRVDVVVCGEVLEHLSNPGWFLRRVKDQWPGVPVIVTVPNAFSSIAQAHVKRGVENVNIDHVAWYSPRTLKTLVERVGFSIVAVAYYNGDGPLAEGLIAVLE